MMGFAGAAGAIGVTPDYFAAGFASASYESGGIEGGDVAEAVVEGWAEVR